MIISILSPVSKILERVIYNQLYGYFSKNKLFHPNVMGYRKNRSTLTAVLQMYDRWVRGAADGLVSGIVLLDLSAAFDLVNCSILLKKLELYGLKSDFVQWIKCYMSNRKQAVWVDHILSDWLDVDVGVPQGSILGPLLFVIFFRTTRIEGEGVCPSEALQNSFPPCRFIKEPLQNMSFFLGCGDFTSQMPAITIG